MTREEFTTKTNEMLAAEEIDRGKLSEDLATLRAEFNAEVTAKEAAEKVRDDLQKQNDSLKEANLNLFMKFGEPGSTDDPAGKLPEENKKDPQAAFDALFKDGELI